MAKVSRPSAVASVTHQSEQRVRLQSRTMTECRKKDRKLISTTLRQCPSATCWPQKHDVFELFDCHAWCTCGLWPSPHSWTVVLKHWQVNQH